VTSPTRSAELPDVPTMAESGYPGLTTVTYYGFWGPAGTPAEVVSRINSEINEALKSPELRANLVRVGFEPTGGSPQDFAKLIAEQLEKWAPIVKSSGFQMD
jgi:tripartite-type tricarboxylate transporter receptor subunit TctC